MKPAASGSAHHPFKQTEDKLDSQSYRTYREIDYRSRTIQRKTTAL